MSTNHFDSIVRPWCEENGIDVVKGKYSGGMFYTFSVHSRLNTKSGVSQAINELFDPSFKKKTVSLNNAFCYSMREGLAKALTEYLFTHLLDNRTDP